VPVTSPSGIITPSLTDAPNAPSALQSMATSLDPRVIPSFASAAARAAAITAPVIGQVTFRQDAAVYEFWAGAVWHAMPGTLLGIIATANQTTSTGTNGVTMVLSPDLLMTLNNIQSGRNYRVVWGGLYRVTVANTLAAAAVKIQQGSAVTTASTTIGSAGKWIQQTSNGPEDVNEIIWTASASGAWNLQLGIVSRAGTGASAISGGQQNAFLAVYAA
jgi:hypothetical protein